MEKNKLVIVISIIVVFLFGIGIGVFYFFSNHNKSTKVFDIAMIEKEAIPFDDLFYIDCNDNYDTVAGSEIICKVMINSTLKDYSIMDDVLEYISFEYDLGDFLSLEDISIMSPRNGNNTYHQFVLDVSEKKKVVLKNNNQHDLHKNVVCSGDKESCHYYGRTASFFNDNSKKAIYDDSISNLLFQFKIKVSDKVKYSDVLKIRINNLYYYSCMYGKTEEDDVKNIYKMDETVYEFNVNNLMDASLFGDSSVLLKVKGLSSGNTPIYINDYSNIIGGNLESGKVVEVIRDSVNSSNNNSINKFMFDNYKDKYYFLVKIDDKVGYVKYSDVEIVPESINYDFVQKNKKLYVSRDEYLYNAPFLYSQDNKVMIPKGTIINSNVYYNNGSACWLYVDYQGNKGWVLEAYHNSDNYPYNNVLYGSANLIEEKSGSMVLNDNAILLKYAFSNEKVMDLPKGIEVKYDYYTSDARIVYYHINYNNNQGWVKILN